MALNSMWQIEWTSAARPSAVKGERVGTSVADTRTGLAGRPGTSASSRASRTGTHQASSAIDSIAVCAHKARVAATFSHPQD